MKKIFFLIAVLFSFTGYAQTVGQLRYDTVKMYKVGGTTELILQNASSGVVGGVLRNVINGRTVFQTVVDTVFKNATADSFVYYIGGVRRAFKDSSGSGTYARDTIVAGRGLTGTTINANKVQLDNDSAVYIVTQINDTTLSFTHYDGSIDTVTIVSSGGGGGSGWSLTGNAGTVYLTNFIGTTDNVSLGFRVNNVNAGQLNVTTQSTGFGVETLNNSTGSRNNAFGWNAGFSNTTGTDNNAVGHASLYSNQTGSNNNAFGYSSLYVNTGSENNAFGYRALGQSVSGTMNTAMGDSSLITLTTGSRNTVIGANADVATSSTDSSGAFGALATASTRQMAFSPYFNTMFLNLDSASGTAPAIAGIDANGNWRKYATPAGGSSQWTDTTAGIYYADKVGIGGVINPANALTVSGSATVGTGHSNAGTSSFISGESNTIGGSTGNVIFGQGNTITGNSGYNFISGTGNNLIGSAGSNVIFGESQTLDSAEASTILYGYGNTIGADANDALGGGTGTNVFALAGIGLGLGHEVNGQASVVIGGNTNKTYGVESGVYAGTLNNAQDSSSGVFAGTNNNAYGKNTVILGGHNITSADDNTAYVENFVATANTRFTGLPTSGTYSKSLAIDASGNIYKKDTLAVSGVYATLTGSETLTNKTITSPTLSGTLIGSGTIGGSTIINTAGPITGFHIVATGLIRSAAASNIEHYGRNKFNATSDGFETLTANSGTANTANLSVGSLRTGYVAKTANYTATAFDETISCSTNAFTITLPTAVGCAGQKYNITNSTAANTITIGTTSSQVFANVTSTPTTISLVGLGAVIVVSDGAAWLQLK